MRCHHLLCCIVVVGAFFVAARTHAAESPPSSEAVAAFGEGMRSLFPEDTGTQPKTDDASIERLFAKGIAANFPYAHYGMACLHFRSNQSRSSEAFAHIKQAADHGVFEAKALLIGYYAHGYGVPSDANKERMARKDLGDLIIATTWPYDSAGAHITIIGSASAARRYAESLLASGECGPKDHFAPETSGDPFPRKDSDPLRPRKFYVWPPEVPKP